VALPGKRRKFVFSPERCLRRFGAISRRLRHACENGAKGCTGIEMGKIGASSAEPALLFLLGTFLN
jgi:hypothetical protein